MNSGIIIVFKGDDPEAGSEVWEKPRPPRRVEVQGYAPVTRRKLPSWHDWFAKRADVPRVRSVRREQWMAERLRSAALLLRQCVTIDPEIRGGVPVLKGTRVPIAQIIAELADDARASEIADDLDLDESLIDNLLEGIAIHLDRPYFR